MKEPVLIVVDHPGPTYELRACCTHCGATVTSRTYDVRETRVADVDLAAVLDAAAFEAHRCAVGGARRNGH